MKAAGKFYSTKAIADIFGVHPNTVRLYERWGYLARAERSGSNYRRFNNDHLRQMRLARTALPGPYPIDGTLVHGMVKKYAAGDTGGAIRMAEEYLAGVEAERGKAVQAMGVLDRWFARKPGSKTTIVHVTRREAAAALGLTVDAIRTWERNGLCRIAKAAGGKMRFSEWDIEKLMVIRLLRNCGYSIASLRNVFGNEANLLAKPSELLSLENSEADISYYTDRYGEYLAGHIDRAKAIIRLLREDPGSA